MSQIRTEKMRSVLAEFSDGQKRHGYQLILSTGYPSGYIYPALWRLEELGMLTGKEESATKAQKRRPRYYYKITAAGKRALR